MSSDQKDKEKQEQAGEKRVLFTDGGISYCETPLTDEVLARLIAMSKDWAEEESCYGYRENGRSDIEGNRIFTAEKEGEIIAYLFGNRNEAKKMTSIMAEGTPYFEIEELYVVPELRSQGIGSRLFQTVCDTVSGQAEFAMLATATKNWRAILHFYIEELGMEFWSARLYKKLGE